MPWTTLITRALLLALAVPMLCAARPVRILHGTVKDYNGSKPLANVRVLTDPPYATGCTDAQGKYRLEVPDDRLCYTIRFESPTHKTPQDRAVTVCNRGRARADEIMASYTRVPADGPLPICRNANMRNAEEHFVYGKVKKLNGQPLEGATVRVPGYRSVARTDARGEYLLVLNPRPSGGGGLCYMVAVRKPGFGPDAVCICGRKGPDARKVDALLAPGQDRQPIRQCGPKSPMRLKKAPSKRTPPMTPPGAPTKSKRAGATQGTPRSR